jgi:hypothetical protein
LVVQVRAALGLPASAAPRPFAAAARADARAAASAVPRAPIMPTEYLERRGLLESLSASEAAAEQTADALSRRPPAPPRAAVSEYAPAALTSPAFIFDSTKPARVPPLVWWSLAFLPAGIVLLKNFF